MQECVDHGKAGSTGGGYHTVKVAGKVHLLHRMVYCNHNNVPIESIAGQVVRHTCDNNRCVNPHHLVLGTQADNMQDMKDRGRWRNRAVQVPRIHKLTLEQRAEIRALLGTVPQAELARRYGVTQPTISRINQRL